MGNRKASDRTDAGGRRRTAGNGRDPSPTENKNADAQGERTAAAGALAVARGLPEVSFTVEDEKLAAAADQVAADYAPPPLLDGAQPAAAGADPSAPPVISTEDAEKGYRMLGLAVVGQSCMLLAPAWHVTQVEQTSVSDAIVQALMIWFPDGIIPAKYLALLVLVSAVGTIALSRIDPVTGELPPRHAPPKKPAVPAAPAAAAAPQSNPAHIQPTH